MNRISTPFTHAAATCRLAALLLLVVVATSSTTLAAETKAIGLRVTSNGRYLERVDGTPFFFLGDTAWTLLHRLTREEMDRYLVDRARKGFTVIQTVILPPSTELDAPNAYGDRALIDGDIRKPNEAYFRHVDTFIDRAAELGLHIGLLPSWHMYWRVGPKRIITAANAADYGRFLGRRYATKPIIWILGGDADIGSSEERATVDALARGLSEGDGGAHLRTYHPYGPGQSSTRLADAGWIDFHMVQSSHGSRDHDNGLLIERDRALVPNKPTVDGEPRYEGIPVGFYFKEFNRHDRFDDYDVRQAAYWCLLAGGAGYTYGNNNVWPAWRPGQPPKISSNQDWEEALNAAGAWQMRHVRRLFESRPFTELVPNESILVDAPRTGGAKVRAALARDRSFAFIYSPRGEPFSIDQAAIKARRLLEIWFDPRYGTSFVAIGPHSNGQSIQTYTPVTRGRGQDWVLVIEDADRKFPMPGSAVYARPGNASR